MLNTSFYHSQQSSRPFRRPNEPCPMMPRSSWYPPKAPHKAANNRHFDDETPGSAIQKIQSERNIFGAPSNHTVVHMPRHKPKRTNAARNSCPRRATIHGTLETTSKEPWDPVRSQDPSASSSSSNPEHTMAVNNMLIIRGHAKSDPLKWVENWDHSNAMQQNAPDHRTSRSQKVEHGPIHPHHVVIVANNPCNYAASSHSQLPIYHPPYYNSTSTCSPSTSSSSSISFHTHHQRRISTDSFEYGRTDVVVDDLHRRASTISDTNVTASTADTYRRFSDGSSLVSSQSTAASSVIIEEEEEEEQKEEHIELQNDDKQHDSNIPTEEIVETNKMEEENEGHEKDQDQEEKKLSNYGDAEEEHDAKPNPTAPCASTTTVDEKKEEEQQQQQPEREEIPIWADPVRIRENPTRYQYVRDYMKRQGLSTQSPLPLPSKYVFYFSETQSAKHQKIATANYMSSVRTMFECETVWQFASRWRQYKTQVNRPSQMQPNQNLYCFLKGVAPMWEDPRNKNGGRLTICPARAQLDEVFDWVLSSFVGGNLSDEGTVGAVLSRRSRGDRVELWLDETASSSAVAALKNKLQGYVPLHLQEVVGSGRFKKHFDK